MLHLPWDPALRFVMSVLSFPVVVRLVLMLFVGSLRCCGLAGTYHKREQPQKTGVVALGD